MSTLQPSLLLPGGAPFTSGVAGYHDTDGSTQPFREPRIYVRLNILGFEMLAMVDTAAPWCILQPTFGDAIRPHVEKLTGERRLQTRLGTFVGGLYRGAVGIVADDGEDLEVDVTFFLSDDWPGGNFIGYLGFLDRLRFAVDAQANLFYFGHPEEGP